MITFNIVLFKPVYSFSMRMIISVILRIREYGILWQYAVYKLFTACGKRAVMPYL